MLNVLESPEELNQKNSLSIGAARNVFKSRQIIKNILDYNDRRMLVIVGPCSFHDPEANLEYAYKLKQLADALDERMYIVMRVYPEKPRTCLGWKGYLSDPNLDGSGEMMEGVTKVRKFMATLCELGLPIATEILNPICYLYYDHMLSWATVGARTVESQVHREIASNLEFSIGFKNNIYGDLNVAINSIKVAVQKQTYFSVNHYGKASIINSQGNRHSHLVLRGGKGEPNYEQRYIDSAAKELLAADLPSNIIVDCSHDNSGKDYTKQPEVFNDVIKQKIHGNKSIVGVMLESFLIHGSQSINDNKTLKYGCSITDGCLSWEQTASLLQKSYKELGILQQVSMMSDS